MEATLILLPFGSSVSGMDEEREADNGQTNNKGNEGKHNVPGMEGVNMRRLKPKTCK